MDKWINISLGLEVQRKIERNRGKEIKKNTRK